MSDGPDGGGESEHKAEAVRIGREYVRRRVAAMGSDDEIRKRGEEINARVRGPLGDPMAPIRRDRERVDLDDARANLQLKKILARSAFIAVGVQLLVADAVFVFYLIYSMSHGWEVPSEVMIGWLSATVVQVVGVVLVIARHLFPRRSARR